MCEFQAESIGRSAGAGGAFVTAPQRPQLRMSPFAAPPRPSHREPFPQPGVLIGRRGPLVPLGGAVLPGYRAGTAFRDPEPVPQRPPRRGDDGRGQEFLRDNSFNMSMSNT